MSLLRLLSTSLIATSVAVFLPAGAVWAQEAPSDHDEILHVLNRITFGPRPGDVEMVEKMGLHNYIEQQLHPELIDDSAVENEVAQFELLQKTPQELAQLFYDDQQRIRAKQKQDAANAQAQEQVQGQAGSGQVQAPAPLPPTQGNLMNLINQVDQWRSVAAIGQMEQAKLVRAINSNRQLQEVLVDFWNNHFNIDMKKGPCRVFKVADDRDVIRPHILGRFRDLLEASAK